MFDKKINVESECQQIDRIVRKMKGPLLQKTSLAEIEHHAKRIIGFIEKYIDDHKHEIHPDKLEHLTRILSFFIILKKTNAEHIADIWTKINEIYGMYNFHSVTYLLRHPEKISSNQTAKETEGQRALSEMGVKQAKAVADLLIEETLITNKPVEITINYSGYKRTRLLAEAVKNKILWMKKEYNKDIIVDYSVQELISGDLIKDITTIGNWLNSENAVQVASLMKKWFVQSNFTSQDKYRITMGVTHLPNIVAFLVHGLHVNPKLAEDFNYVEYIKFDKGIFYYRKKWQ